jgi:protein involved in polysaccharide export with SLBB domain
MKPRCARSVFCAILAIVPSVACTSAVPRPVEPLTSTRLEIADDGDFFAVGDVLVVSIDLDGGPREVHRVVDTDGYVRLPDLGRVCVAGLTPLEARAALRSRFAAVGKWPNVRVEIRSGRSYFIDGAVADDGLQELVDEMTLADAVMRAEPPEEGADLHRVSLARRGPTGFSVEEYDLVCDPKHAVECALHCGDCVTVPSREIQTRGAPLRRTPRDLLARY